jgi:hypothetical protein
MAAVSVHALIRAWTISLCTERGSRDDLVEAYACAVAAREPAQKRTCRAQQHVVLGPSRASLTQRETCGASAPAAEAGLSRVLSI